MNTTLAANPTAIPRDGIAAERSAALFDRLAELIETSVGPDVDPGVVTEAHSILWGLERRHERFDRERDAYRRRSAWLRDRLLHGLAARCAAAGYRRIALYGAGFHTPPIVRHPWGHHGLEVVAVLDDRPAVARIGAVPVLAPADLVEPVDAVVVSSDSHERRLRRRADVVFAERGIPVHAVYGDAGFGDDDATAVVAARAVESALRRYEFAAHFAPGRRVLDVGCGDGAGSRLLAAPGDARHVTGLDADAATITRARGSHGMTDRVEFVVAGPAALPVADGQADLVVAFGAAVPAGELDRVLAPGGLAILGRETRDAAGTEREGGTDLDAWLDESRGRLRRREAWGQVHADEPRTAGRPAGLFRIDAAAPAPDVRLLVLESA